MEPVLRLVPDGGLRAVDHRARHLVAAMGRQAMHEDRVPLGSAHQGFVDLERPECAFSLLLVVIAHGYPDIGDDAVRAARGGNRVLAHLDIGTLGPRPGEQLGRRREVGRRRDPQGEAEACRSVHPRCGDIIGVADPGDGAALDRPFPLLEGHDVGHDLTGMGTRGEAVDHGNCGVVGEFDQRRMRARAQHDGVHIARQDARRVGDRLAAAELHVLRVEHDRRAAKLVDGDLEGDARPRGGLLENHGEHRALRYGERLRHLARSLHGGSGVDDGAQGAHIQRVDIEEMLRRG